MHRVIIAAFAAATLAFTACGGGGDGSEPPAPTATATATLPPMPIVRIVPTKAETVPR